MNHETLSPKKKFKMPHSYVIIFILLLLMCVLTYIIPSGTYARYEDEALGRTVVDPNNFTSTGETNPVSPLKIPLIAFNGFLNQATLIFAVIVIAGAMEIIITTGMFQAFCHKLAVFCSIKGREKLFIPIVMTVFVLLGLTQSTDKFIGMAAIGVMLAVSVGYDAITGIAVVLLGVGIGFSAGAIHATTAVAQEIAGLELYSGMWLRIVATVLLYIVTVIYTSRYAARVKADPTRSYLYQVEGVMQFEQEDTGIVVKKRHYAILAVFVGGIALLMYGCKNWKWSFTETAVLFVWVGLICGLIWGMTPSEICKAFIKGANATTGAALMVGLGASVSLILSEAGIIDTMVHGLCSMLGGMPQILKGPMMYIFNTLVNFLIPSGNGQAAVVMPILTPMSDVIGLSRQTTVLAFKLGDGLSNYVLPHAAALMGFLGVTGIPYDKWMKFMGKLFLIQAGVSIVLCAVAGVIGYV